MITTDTISPADFDDAELVAQTLGGSRDAFGRIVARYKSLICSLAYSATGSITQSEDLAQETFVTAWKELPYLREPEKLRTWLCGIARNLNYRIHREDEHEPSHEAEPLEDDLAAPGLSPQDHAITREEEAILWRSLERIPANYREPLILFYREDHSVERVARILDLTEEAVRQRLVRGRKLLHERVIAFVEGALERTTPGEAFTQGVLAALPLSAAKTVLGASAATGAAVAKGAAAAGTGGLLAVAGSFITIRAQANDAKSPRERKFMLRHCVLWFLAAMLLINVVFVGGRKLLQAGYFQTPGAHGLLSTVMLAIVFLIAAVFRFLIGRRQRKIQMEDGTYVEAEWKSARRETDSAAGVPENKSGANLRTLKLMAIPLAISAIIALQAPWREHLGFAILLTASLVLLMISRFRNFGNRPRFLFPTSRRAIGYTLIPVFFVLLLFQLLERYRRSGVSASAFSPVEITAFCGLLIICAVGPRVFAAWKRKGPPAGASDSRN
jgi:RNA polymerase sigma factor (sigma-70 family)